MSLITKRRQILLGLASLTGLAALGTIIKKAFWPAPQSANKALESSMIKRQFQLGFQWPTQEPFLFCVHHNDLYPVGTEDYGPDPKLLVGRDMGQDFQEKDGFRMYHGEVVPGFPVHPHRGFETVTVVRKGYVDHADSLGAAGRYGQGDVQWMTAGSGVQHSEMFPLIRQDASNTVELFQIWLNLPRANKMAKPHFTMFWSENIPNLSLDNGNVSLSLIAGEYNGVKSNSPPPDSWASKPESEIAVWLVKMKKGSQFELPISKDQVSRSLYFFEGTNLDVNGIAIGAKIGLELDSQKAGLIKAISSDVEFLVLQAKPIGEPIVQHGPFVMNTKEEIMQTFKDYQKTQFGGWPWPRYDVVHGDKLERFAKYPDGRIEKPTTT